MMTDKQVIEASRAPHFDVPRIIHQVFFREDDPRAAVPDRLAELREFHLAINPGWEHRLYDLAAMRRLIGQEWGADMLARFDRIGAGYGAAKADLFRYLLLYSHGGVYFDVKSRLTLPLDEIVRDARYPLVQWPNGPGEPYEGWGQHACLKHVEGGEFVQCLLIAPPRHPFLQAVIDRVSLNLDAYSFGRDGAGRDAVLYMTGPVAYTQAIEPILDQAAHRFERFDNLGFIYVADGRATARRRWFRTDYVHNWRPLVRRGGMTGAVEWIASLAAFGLTSLQRVKNIPGRFARLRAQRSPSSAGNPTS